MKSYIYDTLRAAICTLTLDQAFDSKDEISHGIKHNLEAVFLDYGFGICQALVTDISPNNRVRDAMNEINSSMRIKEASYQRAEGEKILKVKRAEAEAESMHLQGVGVARSRHAIMDGLKESIIEFNNTVKGTSAKDIMDLLILTQYFDAVQVCCVGTPLILIFRRKSEDMARQRPFSYRLIQIKSDQGSWKPTPGVINSIKSLY